MDGSSTDETRELLIGTWVGVAMIVEMLIEQGLVSREDLLLLLSRAQMAATKFPRENQRSPLKYLNSLLAASCRKGQEHARTRSQKNRNIPNATGPG